MQYNLYRFLTILICVIHGINFAQVKNHQLYFTNNVDIDPYNIQSNDFQTHFDIDDNVYAFIKTDGTLEEILPISQRFFYVSTANLPSLSEHRFKTPSKYINPVASYYIFPVIQHEEERENYDSNAFRVMQHLNELPAGEHKISVQLKEEGMVKYASEFTLSVTKKSNDLSSAPLINPNQREKGYLEFGMKQSDYEKAILKLFQDKYPSIGFRRVVITSDKFINQRKSNGRIKSRILNADVLTKRGGKCRAYDITIQQPKVGTDFGVYEIKSINGYYPISCVDGR